MVTNSYRLSPNSWKDFCNVCCSLCIHFNIHLESQASILVNTLSAERCAWKFADQLTEFRFYIPLNTKTLHSERDVLPRQSLSMILKKFVGSCTRRHHRSQPNMTVYYSSMPNFTQSAYSIIYNHIRPHKFDQSCNFWELLYLHRSKYTLVKISWSIWPP